MLFRPPVLFYAYVAGIAVLVGLSLLPSSVHTTYSWEGSLVGLILLLGLGRGSDLCRWLLIGVGVMGSIGSLALQSGSIDLVATVWSVTALGVTFILVSPSMRKFTRPGTSVATGSMRP